MGRGEIIKDAAGKINDGPADHNSQVFRRVLISNPSAGTGAFSRFFGGIQIELIQAISFEPKRIFDGRYWGDCGFIHLCLDVTNMDVLKEKM